MDVQLSVECLEELVYLAELGVPEALRLYSHDNWNPRNGYHDYRKHLTELLALMSAKVHEVVLD